MRSLYLKLVSLVVAIVSMIGFSGTAYAGYECRGTVGNVSIRYNSVLAIGFSQPENFTGAFTGVGVCALVKSDQPISYLSPDACKAVSAILLSAKLAEKKVGIFFKEGNPGDESTKCSPHSGKLDAAKEVYTVTIY